MNDTTTPTPGAELPVVAWFAAGELFHTRDAIPGSLLPPAGTLAALTERDAAQSAIATVQAEKCRSISFTLTETF